MAGGGVRRAPGGGGSRKKPPRPLAGCEAAGGVNRSAALDTSSVSGIVVTTMSAVAVIPGCSRRALLSTLRIVSYVTTPFDVFGVLRISVTRDANDWFGYASTRKVADCPTRTFPISASSTLTLSFMRVKSSDSVNSTGVWNDAATVCPGSIWRSSTMPSIGDRM